MAFRMRVEFSKSFIKAAGKLSGKMKEALRNAIREAEDADSIDEITDCKRLVGFNHVYRVRVGGYRAFFIFHVQIKDGVILFQYLLPRGEAYSKENKENLKKRDV